MKGSKRLKYKFLILFLLTVSVVSKAFSEDVRYSGGELKIYLSPGEPTLVRFPSAIAGGFKRGNSAVSFERRDDSLIVFSRPGLPLVGEAILIQLKDKRVYSLRVLPTTPEFPRSDQINIIDTRVPEYELEGAGAQGSGDVNSLSAYAPRSSVSSLMRQLVLVAEFGKQSGIRGYRRSNTYSGEVVLHDGAIKAVIDEVFMGSKHWGYVLSVENLLDTTQQLNPATFRLDGTQAISAKSWELAPKPLTGEQKVAGKHVTKLYIITRAKSR